MSLQWSTVESLKPLLEPEIAVCIPLRSKSVKTWLRELGIGFESQKGWRLTDEQAKAVGAAALKTVGALSWSAFGQDKPQSRMQSLAISSQEKRFGASPRSGRVSIRAAQGKPLLLDGQRLFLAPDVSHEINARVDAARFAGHDSALVVENLESFYSLPDFWSADWAAAHMLQNPLVVWRGGGDQAIGASQVFCEMLGLPVFAFFDVDPAGLALARAWTGFVDFVAPSTAVLEALMQSHGRADLYSQQSVSAGLSKFIDGPPEWMRVRVLVEKWGKGLPQEIFS